MNSWVLSARIIIPLEALSGICFNIVLFILLFRSDIGHAAQLYRIACMITAILGFVTSLLLLIIQDVGILVNGAIGEVLYGPVLFYFPDRVNDFLLVAFTSILHTQWQMIPAPAIVQWICLTRPDTSAVRRLVYAYAVPILFQANAWYYMRYLIPDEAVKSELKQSVHELHGTDEHDFHMYGVRMFDANGVDLLDMMMFDALPSYIACYGLFLFSALQIRSRLSKMGGNVSAKTTMMQRRFFRIQIAQVLMPLVLMSLPMFFLTFAILLNMNLANLSFVFVYSCFLTPTTTVGPNLGSESLFIGVFTVQAALLLVFVVKSTRRRTPKMSLSTVKTTGSF